MTPNRAAFIPTATPTPVILGTSPRMTGDKMTSVGEWA